MTPEQKSLLSLLKDSRLRGAASIALGGDRLKVAHELESMGLAEWHGQSWGSNFYYITEKGMKVDVQ